MVYAKLSLKGGLAVEDGTRRTYRLIWHPDSTGFRREMEFEEACRETVVAIAQKSCAGRAVDIYESGRLLGSLERSSAGFWIVT